MNHKSLNQLLCAATVNTRFRETLLRDPAKAIAAGYFDHTFALTQEEHDLVVGIRAKGLEDFAAQIYDFISGNRAAGPLARHGHRKEVLPQADALVDLYRAPAYAHA